MNMCFDKRVLGGLATVGLGFLVFAPSLLVRMLPILFIAICPLSMLIMGKMMMGGNRRSAEVAANESLAFGAAYTCPMHGDISATQPGRCPKCGTTLVVATVPQPIDAAFRTVPALEPAEQMALLQMQIERVSEQQTALARQLGKSQAAIPEAIPTVERLE